MTDESAAESPAERLLEQEPQDDALWSRLRVIESQPLAERATAYAALHDEISRRLESAPTAG